MRSITIARYGGPEVLTAVELPDPHPGPGQISIDVTHAAVGMIDVIFRRGDLEGDDRYPAPPFVPGIEIAGTVRAVGAGVEQFTVGEPVVTLSLVELGGYAEITVADAARTVSLKGLDVDPAQAVAVLPNAVTAYLALTHAVTVRQDATVLVHGVTGGLASAFPTVARTLGARRVIGTVANEQQLAQAGRLGLDHVLLGADFPHALNGEAVDLIVDPVGGELRKASLDALRAEGRLLVVGHASRSTDEPFTGDDLWGRSIGAVGFVVGTFLHTDPTRAKPAPEAVAGLVADGTLSVPVQTLPLADAATAHRQLQDQTNSGRLVLTTA